MTKGIALIKSFILDDGSPLVSGCMDPVCDGARILEEVKKV
jgi:hypothetical protein